MLGQFIDLKYAASFVTVRNNVLHCDEKSYNEEVVKLAGYANRVTANTFVGSNESLTRYIHVFSKKTDHPVRVDYRGQKDIPSPTGRDNVIFDNVFYTDDPRIEAVRNDVPAPYRSSVRIENNRVEPLSNRVEL